MRYRHTYVQCTFQALKSRVALHRSKHPQKELRVHSQRSLRQPRGSSLSLSLADGRALLQEGNRAVKSPQPAPALTSPFRRGTEVPTRQQGAPRPPLSPDPLAHMGRRGQPVSSPRRSTIEQRLFARSARSNGVWVCGRAHGSGCCAMVAGGSPAAWLDLVTATGCEQRGICGRRGVMWSRTHLRVGSNRP